jgi:hypothetical protein
MTYLGHLEKSEYGMNVDYGGIIAYLKMQTVLELCIKMSFPDFLRNIHK